MKYVTDKFPTLSFSTKESAEKEAERFGLDVCQIFYLSEWNGEIEEKCIGFGLMKEGKLLSSHDFKWEWVR